MKYALFFFLACALIFSASFISKKDTEQLSAVLATVLVDYTNDSRNERGVGALAVSSQLQIAAQMKADDMASKGYFAHYGPDGSSPWDWMKKAGYQFEFAGENLAVDFVRSKDVSKAWMNSPSHRANIVNNRFTEIGVATARGQFNGRDTIFVVQMFGRPVGADVYVDSNTTPNAPTALIFRTVSAFRLLGLTLLQYMI